MTEVIKGKALRQDLALYDGINPTRQKKSSSGGYVSGSAIGDEVDVLTIHGQGVSRTQTSIQNCINSLGSLNRTIKFSPGTWTIESNTTIPANLTSIIPAGCVFSISSGITLTFSGPVKTDSDNFKTGSGTLTYTDDRMLQSVAGTNTITASTLSTLTVLKNGQEFFIVPANSITGAATLNINSTGAVNLRKNQSGGAVALVANDLIAANVYRLTYYSSGPHFVVANVSAYAQGAVVASAGTINLDTATGDYVHVSGTTTITAVTLAQGQERTIVFDGTLTFTHGASLILPGGASLKTTAGDVALLRGEASGVVRCLCYSPNVAVTSYVSGFKTFIHQDGADSTTFDVAGNVTEDAYESVGPTGSSATNIWTPMDSIPDGARIAIIKIAVTQVTNGTDRSSTVGVSARMTGSSSTTANTGIVNFGFPNDDYTSTGGALYELALVPLDASRRFDISWAETNTTTRSVLIYLQGFIV